MVAMTVAVLQGNLSRSVVVTFITVDDTAIGICVRTRACVCVCVC